MSGTLLSRLIKRAWGPGSEPTDFHSIEAAAGGLAAEYEKIVSIQLKHWGVSETCASVEVHLMGQAEDGREVFVAAVHLSAWERKSALRLLLGLPFLERKVRKAVHGLWLAEVSHFGGLWLHASPRLHEAAGADELRKLMVSLTRPPGRKASEPPAS